MENKRSIALVVQKIRLTDKKKNDEFWQTKSHSARLAALDEIRSEYHRWTYKAQPIVGYPLNHIDLLTTLSSQMQDQAS